jgi:hypothetical protein
MSTQMTTPEQAPAQTIQPTHSRSIFDDMVENHQARAQAEQAKADKICAETYANNANAYVIALGRDYGLGAAHSLQMIWVDPKSGKPNLYAGARATFLQQAGYDWRPVVMTDKEVRLRFMLRGEWMKDADDRPLEVGMTIAEAEQADWVQASRGKDPKPGTKGNYDKFPKNMLFARVISNFHRFFAPHVIGATVYDMGEVSMDSVIAATESKSASKLDALEAELTRELVAVANV